MESVSYLIWNIIVIAMDSMMIYLIWKIADKKIKEKPSENEKLEEISREPGATLEYILLYDDSPDTRLEGRIKEYPCILGRSRECQIVIREKAKDGEYHCSRKHLRISQVNQKFKVERLPKSGEEIVKMEAIADKMRYQDTVVYFKKEFKVRITNDIMLILKKAEMKTRNL